jgi:hypothetical protein
MQISILCISRLPNKVRPSGLELFMLSHISHEVFDDQNLVQTVNNICGLTWSKLTICPYVKFCSVSSTTESSDTSNFADIVTVALAWELSHLLGNCESLTLLNQVLDSNQRCLIW